jgi:hypothetical protein
MCYLEFLRASEGTLSRWSRLHLQWLALTNPHWARVVGYGPLSLCVTHKEGLCPSSGGINRLMMIRDLDTSVYHYTIICTEFDPVQVITKIRWLRKISAIVPL